MQKYILIPDSIKCEWDMCERLNFLVLVNVLHKQIT